MVVRFSMSNNDHDTCVEYEPRMLSDQKHMNKSRCIQFGICGLIFCALGVIPYFSHNFFGWNSVVACVLAVLCFGYGIFIAMNKRGHNNVSYIISDALDDASILCESIEERREDKLRSRRHRHRLNAARRRKELERNKQI